MTWKETIQNMTAKRAPKKPAPRKKQAGPDPSAAEIQAERSKQGVGGGKPKKEGK